MNKIKFAAWSGVTFIAITVISSLINSLFGIGVWSYILTVVGSVFTFGFTYGFFILGKKYKQSWVKGFAVYFMILTVMTMILSIVLLPYLQEVTSRTSNFEQISEKITALSEQYGGEENIPQEEFANAMEEYSDAMVFFAKLLFAVYILYFVFYGIPGIFFGVGLLKLDKKVKFSKAAGILNIVGGATIIVLIGGLVLAAAKILELIVLFKESEKVKQR